MVFRKTSKVYGIRRRKFSKFIGDLPPNRFFTNISRWVPPAFSDFDYENQYSHISRKQKAFEGTIYSCASGFYQVSYLLAKSYLWTEIKGIDYSASCHEIKVLLDFT